MFLDDWDFIHSEGAGGEGEEAACQPPHWLEVLVLIERIVIHSVQC